MEGRSHAQIQHPAAIMRMLHYPGVPLEQVKEENPGIGAHTG
jgi:isopenicillin N synthase-like dioxygenase